MNSDWQTNRTDNLLQLQCEFGSAVFADKSLSYDQIVAKFSDLSFAKLKQIHSNVVVPWSVQPKPADGHFTKSPKQAPMIQTADCMPIIFLGPSCIYSVHAGWRGIEKDIISAAAISIHEQSLSPQDFFVFIGPHIQTNSFEVETDVAKRLLSASYSSYIGPETKVVLEHPLPNKCFINLNAIALSQLLKAGFTKERIYIDTTDTMTDGRFHSYRRDKTPGRQWSFGYLD